jgi:hypothetical protein
MRLILARRQAMQLIGIPRDEGLFFLTAPALNLFFPKKNCVDPVTLIAVDQFYGQSLSRIDSPQLVLMFPQPSLQVGCAAGIVAAIGTFKDVDVWHEAQWR